MGVGFLRLAGAHGGSHVDVVGLHLDVLVDAVIGLPDDDSELVLVERRRRYGVGGRVQPLFLLD